MLSDLAPCFAKIYTVTPNCPRALSAEELQKEARFHTDAEERAGLGFAVMQSFMDKVKVSSTPGRGTRVTLTKRLDARA